MSPTAPPTRRVQTRDGRAVEIRAAAPADAAATLAYLRRVGAESSHLTFGPEGVELTECVTRALFVNGEFHDTVLMGRLVDPPSP